ncbi:MAG: M20/M25/M40 family metallo-hydrolase [Spirochaetaceae bacterium]|nr:MAG: M20/M25/M40 family metallo-hydrolase [Spirochaetaceae bacterium]
MDAAAIPDPDVFPRFEQFLAESFPRVHATLKRETLGDPGLLYTWSGRDAAADPIILTAHYDVVPADRPGDWTHPPFSGAVVDDVIWGRGAVDDKSSLMAILEAAERLAEAGFTPERTVYFAFGGDEEVTGQRGAGRIAAALAERGVRALCLVDEGTAVVENTVRLVDRPVALIGTAEKGYVDIRISARGADGHASMPRRRTTVGRLARALRRIERRPFPVRLVPSVRQFLAAIAEAAPMTYRPILRRPRFFAPVLKRVLTADPKTDALVRTTQAPTMLSGSAAPNVLPACAEAVVNVRILPGETIASVCRRFVKVISDPAITVEVHNPSGSGEPVEASPSNTDTYRSLCTVVSTHFRDAVVVPYLVTATTDSKHYRNVAQAIYRFLPLRMDPAMLDTVHGVDERIGATSYLSMIDFYSDLIETLSHGAEHR